MGYYKIDSVCMFRLLGTENVKLNRKRRYFID